MTADRPNRRWRAGIAPDGTNVAGVIRFGQEPAWRSCAALASCVRARSRAACSGSCAIRHSEMELNFVLAGRRRPRARKMRSRRSGRLLSALLRMVVSIGAIRTASPHPVKSERPRRINHQGRARRPGPRVQCSRDAARWTGPLAHRMHAPQRFARLVVDSNLSVSLFAEFRIAYDYAIALLPALAGESVWGLCCLGFGGVDPIPTWPGPPPPRV